MGGEDGPSIGAEVEACERVDEPLELVVDVRADAAARAEAVPHVGGSERDELLGAPRRPGETGHRHEAMTQRGDPEFVQPIVDPDTPGSCQADPPLATKIG